MVPFSQLSLSPESVLQRYWPSKRHTVEQYGISDTLVSTALHLYHDAIGDGHLGRERTLTALRSRYYWPIMKLGTKKHVERCLQRATYKGVPSGRAPIPKYPSTSRPFDTVAIDLLQLPPCHQGSKIAVVRVDVFSRYVILAPIKEKSAPACDGIQAHL